MNKRIAALELGMKINGINYIVGRRGPYARPLVAWQKPVIFYSQIDVRYGDEIKKLVNILGLRFCEWVSSEYFSFGVYIPQETDHKK